MESVYLADWLRGKISHEQRGVLIVPDFLNPFSGLAPDREITLRELTRGLRLALAAEEEAVHLYEAIADATSHPLAKAALQDIADEERVHAGEFQRLLSILLVDEDRLLDEGAAEIDAMAGVVSAPVVADTEAAEGAGAVDAPATAAQVPTVGSLRGM